MSSFFVVSVEEGKEQIVDDFLDAMYIFVNAIGDGAGTASIVWSP